MIKILLWKKNRIFKLLGIAGVKTESDICFGYSIHLERDVDETYENSYNPECARAWNGVSI